LVRCLKYEFQRMLDRKNVCLRIHPDRRMPLLQPWMNAAVVEMSCHEVPLFAKRNGETK
jgi:hypothetical protein